jgi:2-polyprenyl-3-methyl-5-hydroxy-6-metoxy-1,4-benzoquinol methylase
MEMADLDQDVAEQFSERLVGILNTAGLALMISLGHRLGLFDVLGSLAHATSDEIAEKASLNERYVREWLAALVVGKIVEYDPEQNTYWLPPEHAVALCDSVGEEHFNFAGLTQVVPMLSLVEDRIVDCFRSGGGVPYSEFPRFQAIMAEYSDMMHRGSLVDATLPATGLVDQLSHGIDVLDVGCGRGIAIRLMAEAFPMSRFTGIDFSDEAISFANQCARQDGIENARFLVGDAASLGETDAYDFVTTFDAIHDQALPSKVLKRIHNALRPGGTYLMVEPRASSNLEENLDDMFALLNYTTSLMHCMTVSLAYGGEGLGAMWGEQRAIEYLGEAGFLGIEVKSMAHDFDNSYFLAKK